MHWRRIYPVDTNHLSSASTLLAELTEPHSLWAAQGRPPRWPEWSTEFAGRTCWISYLLDLLQITWTLETAISEYALWHQVVMMCGTGEGAEIVVDQARRLLVQTVEQRHVVVPFVPYSVRPADEG